MKLKIGKKQSKYVYVKKTFLKINYLLMPHVTLQNYI